MMRTIVAPNADVNLDELIDGLDTGEESVLVERGGKPVAVIIAPARYERLRLLERERDWAVIDRLRERNADKDPVRVFDDVTAEIAEARRERRA